MKLERGRGAGSTLAGIRHFKDTNSRHSLHTISGEISGKVVSHDFSILLTSNGLLVP
jgi:hypothetical protein